MNLGISKKSYFFSGCKAMRANFLPLDQPKMRFRWSRKSDDWNLRMALPSHFLLLNQPKMWLFSSR